MNMLGKARTPFLFVLDFNLQQPVVVPLSEVDPQEMLYAVNGFTKLRRKTHQPILPCSFILNHQMKPLILRLSKK